MTKSYGLNLDLKGKTALVCGASGGIGEATAHILAGLGARVIALSRSEDALTKVVGALPGTGHLVLAVDVSDLATLKVKVSQALQAVGGAIEIVVNNTGGPKGGPLLSAESAQFAQAFHQHVETAQVLAQLLVPGMQAKAYGRIINVISTSVRVPIPGLGVSNTVRAAMAGWAKTLSNEVAGFGITVNNVLPGYTNTPRLHSLIEAAAARMGKTSDEVIADWKSVTPAKRFAEPEEIAAAIGFLASSSAGFITGVSLPVDGGRIGAI